ncbi:hypothetical protein [Pseudalkalibacillus berkeleyi]|uniref:Spore protein n=1 Tax=Pseudalkalibacillus berkeleyi TaxID=1069813 RepID=A0ABS9GXD0_9BACL|nr:hypothetical protein [Pseudalkalibacillus berkeleyi]MCF6137349.1 hypothetical protein [Pseudalkalibacillus berkeleyi]
MGRGKNFEHKRQGTINRPPEGSKIAREEFARDEPIDIQKQEDKKNKR